jgi:hypothetical protein
MSGDGSDTEDRAPEYKEDEREVRDPLQIVLRQQEDLHAAMIQLTQALQNAAARWPAAVPPRPATPPVVSFTPADTNPFTPAYTNPVVHPRAAVHLLSPTSASPQSPLLQPMVL